MFTELIGTFIGTIIMQLMWILAYGFAGYTIYYRKKFITVHEFDNSDRKFANFIHRIPGERVINYAKSYTNSNQFYLTNLRYVFSYNSLLKGKNYAKYFTPQSVINTEITYKNPYGWLIIAGITVVFGIVLGVKAADSSRGFGRNDNGDIGVMFGIIFLFLLYAGLFVLLWYYVKGFYLVFDNRRIHGLFCRSSEGLENILKTFDALCLNRNSSLNAVAPNNADIQNSKDVTCSSCNTVLTLEGDDLKSETFVCPVCKTINSI